MNLPNWALRKAQSPDLEFARKCMEKGHYKLELPGNKATRHWMEERGWRRPFFGLESSFLKQFLSDTEHFQAALKDQIVILWLPIERYVMSASELRDFDETYQDRRFDAVVGGLKEYRYAIDAGVEVEIDFTKFTSSSTFYTWVHKRYPLLEEGADDWLLKD
ncbi:MAG TPA: hypothetical protein P5275_00925 [Saprospiraceae bacterium]|nr:hypothetical protein [Saprospiraceae bacterium]